MAQADLAGLWICPGLRLRKVKNSNLNWGLSPAFPPPINWSLYASSLKNVSPESQVFTGAIYFDNFTFTELSKQAGNYTVCQKDVCCHLSYKMAEEQQDEAYALGAFDGLHVIEGEYYLQVKISVQYDGWEQCSVEGL